VVWRLSTSHAGASVSLRGFAICGAFVFLGCGARELVDTLVEADNRLNVALLDTRLVRTLGKYVLLELGDDWWPSRIGACCRWKMAA